MNSLCGTKFEGYMNSFCGMEGVGALLIDYHVIMLPFHLRTACLLGSAGRTNLTLQCSKNRDPCLDYATWTAPLPSKTPQKTSQTETRDAASACSTSPVEMASANSMSHLDSGSLKAHFESCRQWPFSHCCVYRGVCRQTFVNIICSVSSFATGTFHVAGSSLILPIPSWFELVLKTLMHHVHNTIMLEESL